MWPKALLAIGTLLILTILAREIRSWHARRVSRRQRILRVAMAVLMIAILAMTALGSPWPAGENLMATLSYWTAVIGLSFLLVVLALFDMKEIFARYASERRALLHRISEDEDGK
ncbi:MAG: hypothetical protein ACYC2Y_06130 [Armatimonadota bacterium]